MSERNESVLTNTDVHAWLGLTSAKPDTLGGDERGSDGDASDQLVLIARHLQRVVGSQVLAHRWLRRRNASLGDKPIRLLRTADGQARLLRHLERFAER